ncbi:hypothetical protein ASF38_03565 [Aeromicrobium sp. Leaf272]|nr:hypothetical protein ASF38_03565 [Aeromicrobium sp. Leaf272]
MDTVVSGSSIESKASTSNVTGSPGRAEKDRFGADGAGPSRTRSTATGSAEHSDARHGST